MYVDEVDVDEEGIAEMLMDDNAVAQLPRKSRHLDCLWSRGRGGEMEGRKKEGRACTKVKKSQLRLRKVKLKCIFIFKSFIKYFCL